MVIPHPPLQASFCHQSARFAIGSWRCTRLQKFEGSAVPFIRFSTALRMAEMVSSAFAQEGISRVSSYISTKLDDRASRAHTVARLEMALSRLEFVLEWSRKQPITYVSLIRRWNKFRCAYNEGVHLLNKHKLPVLEGPAETGQVVVTSSTFLEQIASAANFFISSLAGLNKPSLSSSVVEIFESYANSAGEFMADVESACPLRRDTFFRYPFVRKLLEGKYIRYERVNGSQNLHFDIWPAILEGRGIEALLRYEYFDTKRRDKSFILGVALRLSESTDIVGTAIDCLRPSASLLNLASQDAVMEELTLLSNLQDISDSYAPPWVGFEYCYALFTNFFRPDALCCQGNRQGPSVKSTMSSELSHLFQEQIIYVVLSCYIPALEYRLASAFDQVGRNVMTDRTPLKLDVTFAPHHSMHGSFVTEAMGSKQEQRFPFGSIQQTVDMTRSRSVDCLICRSEVNDYKVSWFNKHGRAAFKVEKPGTHMAAVPKASGRYNTRSAAKRKR